jgi:hypothetical protein
MSALGGKADTVCGNSLSRSLLGAKRTWLFAAQMYASDPKRTWITAKQPTGRRLRFDPDQCDDCSKAQSNAMQRLFKTIGAVGIVVGAVWRPNDKSLFNDVINLGYVPIGYLDGAKRLK